MKKFPAAYAAVPIELCASTSMSHPQRDMYMTPVMTTACTHTSAWKSAEGGCTRKAARVAAWKRMPHHVKWRRRVQAERCTKAAAHRASSRQARTRDQWGRGWQPCGGQGARRPMTLCGSRAWWCGTGHAGWWASRMFSGGAGRWRRGSGCAWHRWLPEHGACRSQGATFVGGGGGGARFVGELPQRCAAAGGVPEGPVDACTAAV